jgi:LysM repeat protein
MARFSFLVSALLAVALAGTVLSAAILVGIVPTGPGGPASGTTPPPGSHAPAPSGVASPTAVPSTEPVVTPGPTVQPTPGGTYTVQPGDYLTKIATMFGVPWQLIAAANDIAGPDYKIVPGQVLIIPVPPQVTPGADSYVVQSNDTITSIAQHFGVSPTDLADYNNIANWDLIRAGDILYIPGPGWTPLPTPSG